MTPDERVSAWVVSVLHRRGEGWKIHTDQYGCGLIATNVRFDTASTGFCETCYSEYPAIVFDLECTCPKQVPGVRNPTKLRANTNRINFKNMDMSVDRLGGLSQIYAEMAALDRRDCTHHHPDLLHCSEMTCTNYSERCPRHRIAGDGGRCTAETDA